MNLTSDIKQKIVSAILFNRKNFEGTDAKYATSLGIHKSIYAQIKNGKVDRVLADAKWINIARKLNVIIGNEPEWIIAPTPVFVMITKQLEYCQKESTTGIFCDKADIGKTVAGREYVRNHANAVYIDCSLVKTKQKLIRYIAKEFGVDHTGKYNDVFEDLMYYLKAVTTPLIILDEAGDLDYTAWLELKAAWNATENHCGWYMMGADGLESKIRKGIANKKVGFTEIFSRFGARFQKAVPSGTEAADSFINTQAKMIIQANAPDVKDVDGIIRKTAGSLRRVRKEVIKHKRTK